MLCFRKPEPEAIRKFLDAQAKNDLSYKAIGATALNPPSDYVLDHTRVKLGEGPELFTAACDQLRHWQQFNLQWVEIWPADSSLERETVVAIVARSFGLWWVNACRIVYNIDEIKAGCRRFGFAYGTLPDHVGSGEERFLVEIDEAGNVWYDILAFSRPQHILAKIGYPFVRRIQKRFGRDSAASMRQATRSAPVAQ